MAVPAMSVRLKTMAETAMLLKMNFKTTIVLIVLLVIAGGVVFFTQDKQAAQSADGTETTASAVKVFDGVEPNDVTKLVIAPADGKKIVLSKENGKWEMTEPVAAPAEAFTADDLVRAITGLDSRQKVTSKTADANATGLASPKYTIDITAKGKDYTLLIGDKTAVGDNLYIQRKDQDTAQVVAADLLEKLDKQPSDFRDKKLVSNYSTDAINRITIEKPDGKVVLVKHGQDWKITEPAAMPAEKSDVQSILFDMTGLRATEFVSDNAQADAQKYDLKQPRVTVTLATDANALPAGIAAASQPATAPTTQSAPLVIKFGAYDDVLKKNVYAITSQSPTIAKVAASSFELVNKKPIELRDKELLNIDPTQVSRISITSDLSATTKPTTRPASKTQVVIEKGKPATTAPTTQVASNASAKGQATTTPSAQATTQAVANATTHPSTQPASKWEVVADSTRKPADDAKIDELLSQLHPLRVSKYLDKAPTTQPDATYVVNLAIGSPGGSSYEIHLVDPGNSQPLIGTYNGVTFEVDRFIADRLSGSFLKSDAKPANNFANAPSSQAPVPSASPAPAGASGS
jgi:hypothetical protein